MVADLTDKILGKKYDATFDPDDGRVPNNVNKLKGYPCIVYKLISRKTKLERKERLLNMFSDNKTDMAYQIWLQSFICMIQFTIFAGT